ncbi:hypothetical protein ScPMuIL_003095 [Solemya velum]
MGDVLLCFTCCITEQPQPKRRRRIDRSMIGQPQDFRHTGHIGSGDVMSNTGYVSSLQSQMTSKGGYTHVSPVTIDLDLIDLPARDNT